MHLRVERVGVRRRLVEERWLLHMCAAHLQGPQACQGLIPVGKGKPQQRHGRREQKLKKTGEERGMLYMHIKHTHICVLFKKYPQSTGGGKWQVYEQWVQSRQMQPDFPTVLLSQ